LARRRRFNVFWHCRVASREVWAFISSQSRPNPSFGPSVPRRFYGYSFFFCRVGSQGPLRRRAPIVVSCNPRSTRLRVTRASLLVVCVLFPGLPQSLLVGSCFEARDPIRRWQAATSMVFFRLTVRPLPMSALGWSRLFFFVLILRFARVGAHEPQGLQPASFVLSNGSFFLHFDPVFNPCVTRRSLS